MSNTAGTLFVVATPIGNRDDVTLRAIAILRGVDRILAEDTRHSKRLLDHLGVRRPMLALHEHNEQQRVERVCDMLQAGESLALISDAGTPLISDPGFHLVRACRQRGFTVVAIPGPSAMIAALCVSGLPTDRFCFEGFLPRRRPARVAALEGLRQVTATLVFYESAHRILDSLLDLVEVFGGERPAVIARELTKLHETVLTGCLADLLATLEEDENQRKGEFVVMLAGAVAQEADQAIAVDELLAILMQELPLKQAVTLAARISGEKKNLVYQRALSLAGAVLP